MMNGYTKYQEIGLPWLKYIPSHWEVRRNKNVFTERKEIVGKKADEYTLLSLTLNGIIPRNMDGGGKFPESFDKYKIVKAGNIAFCLFDIDETPRTVGLSSYDGMLTGAYTIMEISNINPQYIYYYYLALDNEKMMKPLYTGLRKTININTFQSTKIPVPPSEEQEQIVRFLSWKVSVINKLVGVKQKQIDSLKEFIQSEIERQLCAYPAKTEVRLKQLGTFFKGGGFSRDNLVDTDGYPAILYGDIYTQYEYKTDTITHKIDRIAYTASRKIAKGDIVMAGTGETKDEIGKPILYLGDEDVAVGGDVIVFRPKRDVNAEYLLYQLYSQNSLKHRYISGKGDIIVHIYPTALGNTVVSLPRNDDQKKAVIQINKVINQVVDAISALSNEITVLREFKVRLVADVVTGKIDVRNVKIPEFEFTDDVFCSKVEKVDESGSVPPEGE